MASKDASLHPVQTLEQWLRAAPGGYLHPSVHIQCNTKSLQAVDEDASHGLHWRTDDELPADTPFITVPHSLVLSYLNALVDDAYPVFRNRRKDFTVEAIGFFYLMLQHINRSTSFWKPYLETLPFPPSTLTTPVFFEDEQDKRWLYDTDVWHTISQRRAIYEKYFREGTSILSEAGVDTSQFSWHYFLWSITMFTSRSFSSRSIAPQDSKYWTTYKTGANGQRQTVLLDMSRTTAEDRDFSVLFPAIDAGNHNDVKVHWDYAPGRFSITTLQSYKAGEEVYNNYGPKPNGELLQGYGFCMAENRHDSVLLTLRPPPQELQDKLRSTHGGYFSSEGQWLPEKSTFPLVRLPESTSPDEAFGHLPSELRDLLMLQLRWTQSPDIDVEHCLRNSQDMQMRYLPHIARVVGASVLSKLQRLVSSTPQVTPNGPRQHYAQVYRTAQISILKFWYQKNKDYQSSLCSRIPASNDLVMTPVGHRRLMLLEDIASAEPLFEIWQDFIGGIELVSNTSDLDQLRLAGWEDDIWVLLLSYLHISQQSTTKSIRAISTLINEYASTRAQEEVGDEADDLLRLVSDIAAQSSSAAWTSELWSAALIARVGGRIVQHEGFQLEHEIDGESMQVLAICVPN